ncbi:Retrovirus-related Pol polyprotein [Thelohanellus kitauei]|uniref:Retrovirus-related Pol polyprotein n=1 Tax=Thelohanellus kitauei TaxID=669202 RepID=A0A0C2MV33_THEKT|nr:Retrovirus-related Pol polyprotein [Thelohanellus kitauei]
MTQCFGLKCLKISQTLSKSVLYVNFIKYQKKDQSPSCSPRARNTFRNMAQRYRWALTTICRRSSIYIIRIEQFSKWIEAFPVFGQTAENIVRCSKTIVSRFGILKKLISDQGRQYESSIVINFCRELGIEKIRTSAYHPETNGLSERAAQTIKSKLRLMSEGEASNWNVFIPDILFSLRGTVARSTG